jgi:quercetin dioxygenase-like cupin family protein
MKGIVTAFLGLIVTAVSAGILVAQQGAMSMTEVLRADLSTPGREVVQILAVLPPAAGSASKHTHPGEEVVFVIEGTIRFEVDGDAPVVKSAGESFVAPAGRAHSATNAGSGTARAVATYIVEKGKPRTTMIP